MIPNKQIGIGFSPLPWMDNPEFVEYEAGRWKLSSRFIEWAMMAANAGANWWRMIPWGVWFKHPGGQAVALRPWLYDESESAWDLNIWNGDYFRILREAAEILNDPLLAAYKLRGYSDNETPPNPGDGISLCVALYDQCQAHAGQNPDWNPFFRNVQGLRISGGKCPPGLIDYIKAYASKVIETLNGFDYTIEIGNEITDMAVADAVLGVIKGYGIHPSRIGQGCPDAHQISPVIWKHYKNTEFGEKAGEPEIGSAKMLSVRPVHGCMKADEKDFDQIEDWYRNHPWIRVSLEDDGVKDGQSIDDSDPPYRRPSPEQWKKFIQHVLKTWRFPRRTDDIKRIGFNHLPKRIDLNVQEKTITAMADAVIERGFAVSNKGRYQWPESKPQPIPEPGPAPEPIPEPPKPEKGIIEWWNGLSLRNKGLVGIIVLIILFFIVVTITGG